MLLVLLLAVAATALDGEQEEREKLAFIERQIVNIYTHTNMPEVFEADLLKMQRCGCTYNANKINFGSRVGMQCKLFEAGYKETCGTRCLSPRSEDILLMCPDGWTGSCEDGCIPPDFNFVEERSDFLERNVEAIVKNGYDYINIPQEYIEACGCTDRLRKVHYGTEVGLDCVFNEAFQEAEGGCAGFGGCANAQDEPTMIFCPAGHRPTCGGCEKNLEDSAGQEERYEWMVNLLTGWVRESQQLMEMVPAAWKADACACSGPLKEIEYGMAIGHYCEVGDYEKITDDCGPNVLCNDPNGDLVIHVCPFGFVPNCEDGCGYAWDPKTEL